MLWFTQHTSNPDNALAITELEFQPVISDGSEITPDSWLPVTLPDDWYHSQRENAEGWYRYRFHLNVAANRLWGVYLPSVQQNAAVYLNDEFLGSGGSFDDPVARNWNRPLYFSIPNGLLRPGENVLTIHVKADPVVNGLFSVIYLGPHEFLEPSYQNRYFYRTTLAQFIVISMCISSLLMLMLWWNRRSETLYAWFAVTNLEWAFQNLNMVVIDIPVSTRSWDWMMYSSMLWFPVLASSFVQRYTGSINYSMERLMYGLATSMSLFLLLLPDSSFYWTVSRVIDPLVLIIGAYLVFRLYRFIRKNPQEEAFLLMLTGFILLAFSAHDVLLVNFLISRVDGLFLYYGAPAGLLLFSHILIKRFVSAIQQAEQLNQTLEAQVKEKHLQLEKSYQQLKNLEKSRILMEERARLMRDMHDGIGGHLISTISLIDSRDEKNEPVREALQMALDDLRLMIDSMEEVDGDVLNILAMLRQRMEPRLKQAGIDINWQVRDVPSFTDLGPEKSLQLLRLFQEAVTNVLKHANASQISFSTSQQTSPRGEHCVCIECADNGRGLSAVNGNGRGLFNMQHRASRIGGYAEIKNSEQGGVLVALWVPVRKTQERMLAAS